MSHRFFYTPAYVGPVVDSDGITTPGITVTEVGLNHGLGAGIERLSGGKRGMANLLYDPFIPRCVVRILTSTSPEPGWEEKSKEDVLEDYPGLDGVD